MGSSPTSILLVAESVRIVGWLKVDEVDEVEG